jgi:glucokinase
MGESYRLGPVVQALHPAEQTCDAFVEVLCSLGMKASTGITGVAGAALAMPGPFDYEAGISHMRHKLPYLFGVDLRQLLARHFGWQPSQVRFLNDAAAYMLGEIGAGAARGVPRAVGITLGTGIGSAFAVNGRIVTEGPGVPSGGEIWNLPYGEGTIEDAISTRAIQDHYQQRAGALCKVSEIAALAADHAEAAEVFIAFGRHLGLALRQILAEFTPDVVVIGGGISRSAHLFLSAAQQELQGLNLQLRVSTLLDNAPLVGAAVAWRNSAQSSTPDAIGVASLQTS